MIMYCNKSCLCITYKQSQYNRAMSYRCHYATIVRIIVVDHHNKTHPIMPCGVQEDYQPILPTPLTTNSPLTKYKLYVILLMLECSISSRLMRGHNTMLNQFYTKYANTTDNQHTFDKIQFSADAVAFYHDTMICNRPRLGGHNSILNQFDTNHT